jgi:hypothetical protein
MKFLFVVLFALPFYSFFAHSKNKSRFEFAPAVPSEVLQRICLKPFGVQTYRYEQIFSEEFRKAVTEKQFRELVFKVVQTTGVCSESEVKAKPEMPGGMLRGILKTVRANLIYVDFKIDDDGFVEGFLVKDVEFPGVVIRNWNDVAARLSRLPGLTTLSAGIFGRSGISIRGQ